MMRPGWVLRAEGLAVCAFCIAVYCSQHGSWLLFAALFLAPDLSMLGYLGGVKVGAAVYNLFHTYVFPIGLWLAGDLLGHPLLILGALIWGAHIGFDRLLGFGLKYDTDFKDTHLNRV